MLQSGDLVLVDMGCEYYRYGSDITAAWPATGKFSGQQAEVYNAVLRAHTQVIAALKPGVSWPVRACNVVCGEQ
jgi:Xaa-Pro aminopeptidase